MNVLTVYGFILCSPAMLFVGGNYLGGTVNDSNIPAIC